MEIADIKKNIEKILDNNKAQNITSINLKNKSYIADYMIIASGTSSRHLQSLSENLPVWKSGGCNSKGPRQTAGGVELWAGSGGGSGVL